MTFSIAACCAGTSMFGVATSSSSPAVAARCAYARAGIGAATSQNITDPPLGPRALDLLALATSAATAIEVLRESDQHMDYRQVLLVDAAGRDAVHSGPCTLGVWAATTRQDVECGGNMLANAGLPDAMAEAFLASSGHLGDRLLVAMRAGMSAGGEAGPVHSAGPRLVDTVPWLVAGLGVDWTEDCSSPAWTRSGALQAADGRLRDARIGPGRCPGRRLARRPVTPSLCILR